MSQAKWDRRFLDLAALVASWSKDPSTQTGAVIVSPDRKGVYIGYNGFPRPMLDLPENYDNREQKYSRIIHCEMNALLSAGRHAEGGTLYTYPLISCDRCFVHMAQAGVKRFVGPRMSAQLAERWEPFLVKTRQYAQEMGLELVEVDEGFPQPVVTNQTVAANASLWVAVAPNAAAGPYPTTMRPATTEEAARYNRPLVAPVQHTQKQWTGYERSRDIVLGL